MGGRSMPGIWGKGWRFLGIGPTFWPLWLPLERSWHLKMSHSTCWWPYPEAQGLVEVNWPTILDLFGSSQFRLCPRAMFFFQRVCPALFPPVWLWSRIMGREFFIYFGGGGIYLGKGHAFLWHLLCSAGGGSCSAPHFPYQRRISEFNSHVNCNL